MGQSCSAQVVYGWRLTEEELGRFELQDLDDWASANGLEYDVGGHIEEYEWCEYVVGKLIEPRILSLGVHEIADNYGEIDVSVYKELRPFVEYFGREPRKYMVMNYGYN